MYILSRSRDLVQTTISLFLKSSILKENGKLNLQLSWPRATYEDQKIEIVTLFSWSFWSVFVKTESIPSLMEKQNQIDLGLLPREKTT